MSEFNFTATDYASNFKMVLVRDAVCASRSLNAGKCYYVRLLFNSEYLDLGEQNTFPGSWKENKFKAKDNNSTEVKNSELEIHNKFDLPLPYFTFTKLLGSLLFDNDLLEACEAAWSPKL